MSSYSSPKGEETPHAADRTTSITRVLGRSRCVVERDTKEQRAASSWGWHDSSGTPSKHACPEEGATFPLATRTRDVFPAPFAPRTTHCSWHEVCQETSRRISVSPRVKLTSLSSITVSIVSVSRRIYSVSFSKQSDSSNELFIEFNRLFTDCIPREMFPRAHKPSMSHFSSSFGRSQDLSQTLSHIVLKSIRIKRSACPIV